MTTMSGSLPPQGPRNPRGRRGGGLVPAPLPSSSYDGLSGVCHAGTPDNRTTAEEEGCSCGELQRGLLAALRAITALIENLGHLNRCPRHSVGVSTPPTRKRGAGSGGGVSVSPRTYAEAAGTGQGKGGGRSASTQTYVRSTRGCPGEAASVAGGIVPPRCYRCLARGHERRTCPSAVDRSNSCLHCGVDGHKARGCTRRVHCPACSEAGRSATHRVGGRSCPEIPPLPIGRRRNRNRRKRKSSAAKGGSLPSAVLGDTHGVPMEVEAISEADTIQLTPASIGEEGMEGALSPPSPVEAQMEVETGGHSLPHSTSVTRGEDISSPPTREEKGGTFPPPPREDTEGMPALPPEDEEDSNEESDEDSDVDLDATYSVWGGYLPSPGDACPWRWKEDIILSAYWVLPRRKYSDVRKLAIDHMWVERLLRYTASALPIWPFLLPNVVRDPDPDSGTPPDRRGYGSLAVTYRGPLELEEASQIWEACVGIVAKGHPEWDFTFDAECSSPPVTSPTTAEDDPGGGSSHPIKDRELLLPPVTLAAREGVNITPPMEVKGRKKRGAKECPPLDSEDLGEGRKKHPPSEKKQRKKKKGGRGREI